MADLDTTVPGEVPLPVFGERHTWAQRLDGRGTYTAHALDRRGDTLCGSHLPPRLMFHDAPPTGRACGRCARIIAGRSS